MITVKIHLTPNHNKVKVSIHSNMVVLVTLAKDSISNFILTNKIVFSKIIGLNFFKI